MTEPGLDDFAAATEALRGSFAWAMVERAIGTLRVSADQSRLVAAAKRMRRAFDALPRSEQVRAIAITAAVAAAGHALLVGLMPLALRPAMPRVFWLIVSIVAAGVAIWSGRSGAGRRDPAGPTT